MLSSSLAEMWLEMQLVQKEWEHSLLVNMSAAVLVSVQIVHVISSCLLLFAIVENGTKQETISS